MSDLALFGLMVAIISGVLGLLMGLGHMTEWLAELKARGVQLHFSPGPGSAVAPRASAQPLPPVRLPPPVQAPAQVRQPPLGRLSLQQARSLLQEAHHIAVLGDTGSGKTTFGTWLVHHLAGQLVIIDPKWRREEPPRWGGLPAAKMDADGSYTTIEQALKGVFGEFQRRVALSQQQLNYEAPPLVVVWDEINDTMEGIKETAGKVLRRGLRIFREYRIKLVICPQSDRVEALGLAGHGDARKNLLWVYLGDFARDELRRMLREGVLPPWQAEEELARAHPAVLIYRSQPYVLDTTEAVAWRTQPVDRWRAWEDAQRSPDSAKALAMPQIPVEGHCDAVAQSDVAAQEEPAGDVAQQLAGIDFALLALLFEEKILTSETAVLKALGIPPSSTSTRYAEAKRLLAEARQRLKAA